MDKYGRELSFDAFMALLNERNDAEREVKRLRTQSPAALVTELKAAEARLSDLQRRVDKECAPHV